METCRSDNLLSELVYEFPIPLQPVVTYPCGHKGGSFEESFPIDVFLSAAFHETILPVDVRSGSQDFMRSFDPSKPWFIQLRKFCAARGFVELSRKKTALAERLASEIEELPSTYAALEQLIRHVRKTHPVKHPDDVVLPAVRGLTTKP